MVTIFLMSDIELIAAAEHQWLNKASASRQVGFGAFEVLGGKDSIQTLVFFRRQEKSRKRAAT